MFSDISFAPACERSLQGILGFFFGWRVDSMGSLPSSVCGVAHRRRTTGVLFGVHGSWETHWRLS